MSKGLYVFHLDTAVAFGCFKCFPHHPCWWLQFKTKFLFGSCWKFEMLHVSSTDSNFSKSVMRSLCRYRQYLIHTWKFWLPVSVALFFSKYYVLPSDHQWFDSTLYCIFLAIQFGAHISPVEVGSVSNVCPIISDQFHSLTDHPRNGGLCLSIPVLCSMAADGLSKLGLVPSVDLCFCLPSREMRPAANSETWIGTQQILWERRSFFVVS